MTHFDADTLAAGLPTVAASPTDHGTLELIVARPAPDERLVLDEGELSVETGLVGDTWAIRPSTRSSDGRAHPDMQLNIMNARAAALVAGDRSRWPLAGDQLYVDLDLSGSRLVPGTRLAIGDAVVEVTDQPHRGCAKFTRRFGLAAHRLVNSEAGIELNLRGINARVVQGATVRTGDRVIRC